MKSSSAVPAIVTSNINEVVYQFSKLAIKLYHFVLITAAVNLIYDGLVSLVDVPVRFLQPVNLSHIDLILKKVS